MDIGEARKLSDPELENALKQAKLDLWQTRFALSTRQLKDYSQIPADPSHDRPDPHGPARAGDRSRADGVRRRR